MSPIGRIFVVLNLILAAAFLGWASNALATTDDYKGQLEAKETEFAETQAAHEEEKSQLNLEISQLTDQGRGYREERDANATTIENLRTQLAEAKRTNEALGADVAKIQATLADYNSTISRLSDEKDRAVQAAQEAMTARDDAIERADEAEMARRDAVNAQQEAETRIADLEAERTSLQDDLSRAQTEMATLVAVTGVSHSDITNQPDISGTVLDVRHDLPPGLVMLNVGKANDVRRGYTFEIYRGGKYKGQVRVENVQENISSALVLNAVPGTTIEQGDSAVTRL